MSLDNYFAPVRIESLENERNLYKFLLENREKELKYYRVESLN